MTLFYAQSEEIRLKNLLIEGRRIRMSLLHVSSG